MNRSVFHWCIGTLAFIFASFSLAVYRGLL